MGALSRDRSLFYAARRAGETGVLVDEVAPPIGSALWRTRVGLDVLRLVGLVRHRSSDDRWFVVDWAREDLPLELLDQLLEEARLIRGARNRARLARARFLEGTRSELDD